LRGIPLTCLLNVPLRLRTNVEIERH
jgi:hypothetical protein